MVHSTSQYVKAIKSTDSAVARKALYKHRQSEIKKEVIRKYDKAENIKKKLTKYIDNLSYKPTSRRVFKKDKQATVVYRGSNPNSHFKQEWEQQGSFLSWK